MPFRRSFQKVAVVIPAFNEELTIRDVIVAIPKRIVDLIVVIDDASRDLTSRIARDAGAIVVRHGENSGVGASIKSGYCKAVSLGADMVLVVAGDGQHDPQEIPFLMQPLLDHQADYVVGDRLGGKPRATGMSKNRHYAIKLLTFITRIITHQQIRDSQCGFSAISSSAIRKIRFPFITDGWGVPIDILVECALRDLRVRYVPVTIVASRRPSYISPLDFAARIVVILTRGFLRCQWYWIRRAMSRVRNSCRES